MDSSIAAEVRTCKWCQADFTVTSAQRTLLNKMAPTLLGKRISIPLPTLCPECRNQRRLSHKNDCILYARPCSLTGKRILSIYNPEAPFPVYDSEVWLSDKWDPLSYGREFDFSRPFFPQYKELLDVVPRRNLYASNCENCDTCSQLLNCRDCYLITNAAGNERCMYMYRVLDCTDCVDGFVCFGNELCYECIDTTNSYDCRYCSSITHCSESLFLENCRSCQHCFMCSGLRNQSYCYKNKKVTPQEYAEILARYNLGSFSVINQLHQEYSDFLSEMPQLFATLLRTEEVTGDNISEAKRCERVFDGGKLEDVHNCHFVNECTDTGDVNIGWQQTLHYESITVGASSSDVAFCADVWPTVSHLYYCTYSQEGVRHCFGSTGLRRKEYCILNKQYSPAEYEKLAARIIEHMRTTGEWGEFFPPGLLGTGYQESIAMCYYPLKKEEALSRGFLWSSYQAPAPSVTKVLDSSVLPDSITEVSSDITDCGEACAKTGRLFRIVGKDLEFYRKHSIPLPRHHPHERHLNRIASRNPRRLWETACNLCNVALSTSCDPAGKRPILCQSCFEERMYG